MICEFSCGKKNEQPTTTKTICTKSSKKESDADSHVHGTFCWSEPIGLPGTLRARYLSIGIIVVSTATRPHYTHLQRAQAQPPSRRLTDSTCHAQTHREHCKCLPFARQFAYVSWPATHKHVLLLNCFTPQANREERARQQRTGTK